MSDSDGDWSWCPGTAYFLPGGAVAVMDDGYFLRRLIEELERAETATSAAEREAHLQACHHYRELLGLNARPRARQR